MRFASNKSTRLETDKSHLGAVWKKLRSRIVFTLIDTHYSLFQSILRLAVPEHVSQKIRKQLDSLQSEDSKNR